MSRVSALFNFRSSPAGAKSKQRYIGVVSLAGIYLRFPGLIGTIFLTEKGIPSPGERLSNLRRIIISLLINGLSLYAASWLVPGIVLRGVWAALVAAAVLALANTFIKPILVFLTLPVTIVSLGLFIFVINALIFLLVSRLVGGFEVHGFGAAFWGALVTSIVSWVLHLVF